MTRLFHGKIRGNTIELSEELGLAEGQDVEISVRPVSGVEGGGAGGGFARTEGALAADPHWDAIMDEIHRPRRLERSEFNLTHLTLFLCIVSTAVGCDPASPNDREAGAHAPAATGDQRAESASAEPLAGKTEFDVVLIEVGNDKIGVIKVVRSATGLGLKDAKDLVEAAPKPIMTGMPKADGERLKSELEAVGAIVELR